MGENTHTIPKLMRETFDNFSPEELQKRPLVIGFSGGPDSTALAHAVITSARTHNLPPPVLAHLNHQWRPEADHDAQWCAQFAAQYQCVFITHTAEEYTQCAAQGNSREESGRLMRRAFLHTIAEAYNSPAIMVAHHANDQIETLLMRLIRGTSLTGLTGIKKISYVRNRIIVRPFLDIFKQDIFEYLQTHGITYLTDSSNNSADFLRNRIRHELVPALIKTDSRAEINILRSIGHICTTEEFVAQQAQEHYTHAVDYGTNVLDCKKLKTFPREIQRRVLILWLTHAQIPVTYSSGILDELIRFLISPRGGTHIVSPTCALRKSKNRATLSRDGQPSLHSVSPHKHSSFNSTTPVIIDRARITDPHNVP